MAGPTGFEPAISSVTGRRDRPLHYEPLYETTMRGPKLVWVPSGQVFSSRGQNGIHFVRLLFPNPAFGQNGMQQG